MEFVPAGDWRKRRKSVNAACGANWRRVPLDDGGVMLLYETAHPTEQLEDLLEAAAFAVLENAKTRRANLDRKKEARAYVNGLDGPQLKPLHDALALKRPDIAKARAFLDSIDAQEVLDAATLAAVRAALDVLASKSPNVSPPRRKRTAQDAQPAQPPAPRAKPTGTVLVSKPYHRRAILDVLNRLQIPWERRQYGGWQTAPLDDAQRLQLVTALVFAVRGAVVPAGVLNSARVPRVNDDLPSGKVYLNPHHALLDAQRNRRKVPQLERIALE